MTLSAVLQRLDDVCIRLDTLQGAVERLLVIALPQLAPRDAALVDALGDVFGAGPIKTHEIVAVIRSDFGNRPTLRSAITDLVGSTHDSQRLGLALRRICADGGLGSRWCLTAPTKEGGARVWCIGVVR